VIRKASYLTHVDDTLSARMHAPSRLLVAEAAGGHAEQASRGQGGRLSPLNAWDSTLMPFVTHSSSHPAASRAPASVTVITQLG
jgi:hypothetical protein